MTSFTNSILIRSLGVWLLILLAAVGNGAFRDLVLVPAMGDGLARAASCVTLSALILIITLFFITRLGMREKRQLWLVGWFWLALSLAFEFLFWHYVGGEPWSTLLEDYNVLEGRLWILVILTTLLAPVIADRINKVS